MFKYFATSFVLMAVLIPVLTQAETVLRTGDGITVESDQVVEGDYYVSVGPFGATVMSGSVAEDMYAIGGTVTINGAVGGDVGVLGGIAQMHATVTDDVRIASAETIIADYVGGDLVVFSGVLKILSTATVEGDIIFYGGDAEINGVVGGSIYGTSKRIRVDARVGGDIDIRTSSALTLGGRADIAGDVLYASRDGLNRAQSSVVAGSITEISYKEAATQKNTLKDLLTPLFVSLFATLSIYLLFRRQLEVFIEVVDSSYLKSSLVGIAALLLAPILSVLLMVTVLGFFMGLIGFAITILFYTVGLSLSSVVMGAILAKITTKKMYISLPWIIIGALVLQIALYIPVVGPLLVLLLFTMATGGFTLCMYRSLL